MNSPPDSPLSLRNAWESSGRGVVEEYLDDFCLPLAEVMPERDVAEYRMLAREHLRDIEDEFLTRGMSEHFARHAALREHGDPHRIGKMLQSEWLKDGKRFVPTDARLQRFALWASAFHLFLLPMLWLGGFLSLFPYLLCCLLTGWITGALGAISPRRGIFALAGAAFCFQCGMTSAVTCIVWPAPLAVIFLVPYGALALTVAVKTNRRLRARQQERLLRTLQKA